MYVPMYQQFMADTPITSIMGADPAYLLQRYCA